jgi:hypothetical protein
MKASQRVKRVAVLAPRGAGEKVTVLSLFHALFISPVVGEVAYPILSADLRAELDDRRKLRRRAEPEQPPQPDEMQRVLRFDWADGDGGCAVEVIALPAEAMHPEGRVDSRQLAEWLRAEGYDLAIVVLNPHTLWAELGRPAFRRVILRYMALGRKAEASAYTLGDATLLAAQAVFGLTRERFAELNIGWEAVPESIKSRRFTRAHRSRDLEKILEAEGAAADDVAEYIRGLELIVQSSCGETGELAIVRDLLKMPHTILGLSHFDIGESSGISQTEYDKYADGLLPDDRQRFRKDIVFLKNVHVEMQPPPLEAVYVRDVRPDGGIALWEAMKPHLRAVLGHVRAMQPVASVPEPPKHEVVEKPEPRPAIPTPVNTFVEELRLPPPPPRRTRTAIAREWVVMHPRSILSVVGALLVTTLVFAWSGFIPGLLTLIGFWAVGTAAVLIADASKPKHKPEPAPAANGFAHRGTDLTALRNGHSEH